MKSFGWVPHPVPPPPTCVFGFYRVPFLWLGVCQGSCPSGQGGQDAGERLLGVGRPAWTELLQQALPSLEGD